MDFSAKTDIQINTGDLVNLLAQQHMEKLQGQLETLEITRKAIYAQLDFFITERDKLLEIAWEVYKLKAEKLLKSFAAFLPRKERKNLYLLCLPLDNKKYERKFYECFGSCFHGDGTLGEFKTAYWYGSWGIYIRSQNENCDDELAFELPKEVENFKVKIPEESIVRINDIISQINIINAQKAEIRKELKDLPALEKRLAAQFTQQLLQNTPELLNTLGQTLTQSNFKQIPIKE